MFNVKVEKTVEIIIKVIQDNPQITQIKLIEMTGLLLCYKEELNETCSN